MSQGSRVGFASSRGTAGVKLAVLQVRLTVPIGTKRSTATNEELRMDRAQQLIEEWRTEASTQVVFSSSRVQDRLFELWGEVRDTPSAADVETWLTLTLSRELFSGQEIVDFLDAVVAMLGEPVHQG
jgi:hypothetical protein